MTQVRIFISSPGDVNEERTKAKQVVDRLQDWYGAEQVELVSLLWENLPLQAVTSFQAGVDAVLSKTSGVDIAVFILWSRLGTPLGPEIRKSDGTTYRSGTEREFDLMWQANRASEGERPAMLVYVRKDDRGFHDQMRGKETEKLKELVVQREAVEGFLREQFQDPSGHNRGAYHTFPDPVSFAHRLRAHLKELIDARLQSAAPRDVLWAQAPYRGLEYFDLDHARIFFGRDLEVCDILQILRGREAKGEASFVCIVGASGAGKSSLARAGVGAALLQDRYDSAVGGWRVATFVPCEAGGSLQVALAGALARALPELQDALSNGLRPDAGFMGLTVLFDSAVKACLQTLGSGGRSARLLLIVDQLEQIYLDPRIGSDQRAEFWTFLGNLSRSGLASVVTTLRSDYYAPAQGDDGFLAIKGDVGMYDLTPVRAEALESVILRPASLSGLGFERDDHGNSLSGHLLKDAHAHPEWLPSLQDLLRALYERRDARGCLTFAAYKELGGITGVVGRRAEAIFATLPPAQQDALPTLLRRLVTIRLDTDVASTRPINPAEIAPDSPEGQLVAALLAPEARLLVARKEGFQFAHETLLRVWRRAERHIEEDREHHRTMSRLEDDFKLWQEDAQSNDLLLPEGVKLRRAEGLIAAWGEKLVGKAEVKYVARSRAKIRKRLQRRRLAVSAAVLVLLTVMGIGAAFLIEADSRQKDAVREAKEHAVVNLAKDGTNRLVRGDASLGWSLIAAAGMGVAPGSAPPTQLESSLDELWSHPRPPVVLRGHDRALTDVALSPDGRRAVTASDDATTRLWDTGTGRTLAVLHGHEYRVSKVAFSRDGAYVATGSDDATVRVWDAATGQQRQPILQHRGNITGVAFCASCDRLLTASRDGTAIVWDAHSGKAVRILDGHEGPVLASALSSDGKLALTASNVGPVRLWDIDSSKQPTRLPSQEGNAPHVAFSRDGQRILTATDGGWLHVWDRSGKKIDSWSEAHAWPTTTDGERIFMQRNEDGRYTGFLVEAKTGRRVSTLSADTRFVAARFSADGSKLLTAAEDGVVQVWEVLTGRETGVMRGHSEPVKSIAIGGDGRHVLTGSQDGTARLWEGFVPPNGNVILPLPQNAISVTFSADSRLVLAASGDRTARLWNLEGRELAVLRGHDNGLSTASFGPEGTLLTSSEDGTARLWNADGSPLAVLAGHTDAVSSAVFSPDGKTILTASEDATARLWDALRATPLAVLRGHRGPLRQAVFNPAGNQVATIAADETARLWSRDGKELAVLKGHEDALLSLAFSPDGRWLATTSRDSTVRLWDAASGRPVRILSSHQSYVAAVAWSPDGKWLATASGDRSARIWDVESGAERAVLRGHEDAINAVAFSPDGKSLLTVSDDKSAREWDVATGRGKVILNGHEHWVGAVAWSPDGKRIATAAQDRTVRLWLARRDLAERADYAQAMSPEPSDHSREENAGQAKGIRFERPIASSERATACDTLAASPFDAQRLAPGVIWAKIDGKAAVEACRKAVVKSPDAPRLRYQLGRALDKFRDHAAALAAYEIAAKQGYPRAQGAFGTSLLESGGENRKAEGIAWLRRAAEVGDSFAQTDLALNLQSGTLMPRDLREAKRLARLAGAQGVPEAHQTLAEIAEEGDPTTGLQPDNELAFFHHALAARCAEAIGKESSVRFANERRAALARLLPQETVVALWRRAREWKPGMSMDVRP
ncbi:MAG: PD40 domain-containing protein [Betaproteobacteria bacterium]|nr:PD40 domain-containing protein [Betaproteobacteria bacterium]